jgi:LPXTG-site transpeptidase (sortase) family protein
MSEKSLLLPSTKLGVLVPERKPSHWWRSGAVAFGVLAVVVGAADVASRVSGNIFGEQASFAAFAPLGSLLDPSFALDNSDLSCTNAISSTTAPFLPTRLKISSIDVDAQVESVGKKSDGSMGTPTTFDRTAWYKLGGKPGGPGNAVIAGHVNNALTTGGVFEHLSLLKIGDKVEVSDNAGNPRSYTVREISEYKPDEAPLETIFATSGPSQIVLITCDGEWDTQAHQFKKRLVVVAR